MSGLGIDTIQLTQSVYQIGTTQAIGQTQCGTQGTDAAGDQSSSVGQASSVSISKQAQFLTKLQQLQQQDPAKFKQVLTDISDKLTQAAQGATGQDQTFLTNLADKFKKAADGDLSVFQPQQKTAGANSVQAAYAQSAPSADPLAALTQSQNSQQSGQSGGHHHHHHHGGSGSSATQQTLSSVFQELNQAFSSLSGSSTTTDPTQTAAALTTAPASA